MSLSKPLSTTPFNLREMLTRRNGKRSRYGDSTAGESSFVDEYYSEYSPAVRGADGKLCPREADCAVIERAVLERLDV